MLVEAHGHKVYDDELDEIKERIKMAKMMLDDIVKKIADIEERTTHNEYCQAEKVLEKTTTSCTQFPSDEECYDLDDNELSEDFDNMECLLKQANIPFTVGSSDGITSCIILSDNIRIEFEDDGSFEYLNIKDNNKGETESYIIFELLYEELGMHVEEVFNKSGNSLILTDKTSFNFDSYGKFINITKE